MISRTGILRWQRLSHAIVNKAIIDYCDSCISGKGKAKSVMKDVSSFLRSDLFKEVLCQIDPRLSGVTIKAIRMKVHEYTSTSPEPSSLGFYRWMRGLAAPTCQEPSWWGREGGEI